MRLREIGNRQFDGSLNSPKPMLQGRITNHFEVEPVVVEAISQPHRSNV